MDPSQIDADVAALLEKGALQARKRTQLNEY